MLAGLPSPTPRAVLLDNVAQRSAGCDHLNQFRLRRQVHKLVAKIYDVIAIDVTDREIAEQGDEPPDRTFRLCEVFRR